MSKQQDSFEELDVKGLMVQTRRVTEVARKQADSANKRSNETQKEVNQLIFAVDRIQTDLIQRINTLQSRVSYLEIPWYKRVWDKVCRRTQ